MTQIRKKRWDGKKEKTREKEKLVAFIFKSSAAASASHPLLSWLCSFESVCIRVICG